MKKRPMKKYEKESGRHPMIGIMTGDSEARKATYVLMGGCNYFSVKRTSSWPLAIWTEQDMLEEIREEEVPIPTVYGEIVEDFSGDMFSPKLRTSGEDRTGCMFCMFGVHKDGEDNRFTRMKRTHPKIYEFCMRPREQGGLGLARVLDFMKIPH
jgi:3'-phosphoadenosine 5'-phosphosulfate sulfotransferase (PAPS reductase)/FAD synthetase